MRKILALMKQDPNVRKTIYSFLRDHEMMDQFMVRMQMSQKWVSSIQFQLFAILTAYRQSLISLSCPQTSIWPQVSIGWGRWPWLDVQATSSSVWGRVGGRDPRGRLDEQPLLWEPSSVRKSPAGWAWVGSRSVSNRSKWRIPKSFLTWAPILRLAKLILTILQTFTHETEINRSNSTSTKNTQGDNCVEQMSTLFWIS